MISLNYRDARPICEQVKDGLRHLMDTGGIQAGDRLPSVRSLASTLAINPNTVRRAYEALEQEGCLRTAADGEILAAGRAGAEQSRRDRLLHQFDDSAAQLLFLGMTAGELELRLRQAAGKEDAQ